MHSCAGNTCAHTVIAAGLQKLLRQRHVRIPPPHPNPSSSSTAALSWKKSHPHLEAEMGRGPIVTLHKHKALTTQWRRAWGELGRFDSSTCRCTPPPSCHLYSYSHMREGGKKETISLDHSCYRNTQGSFIFMSDTSFQLDISVCIQITARPYQC